MAGIGNHNKGYEGYIRSGVTGSNHPFDASGHPGKWQNALSVNGTGQSDFTGSRAGVGAISVTSGAGTIHLTGGGTVEAASLAQGGICELSVKKVTAGVSLLAYALRTNTP